MWWTPVHVSCMLVIRMDGREKVSILLVNGEETDVVNTKKEKTPED